MNKENNFLLNQSQSQEWDEGIFIILIALIIVIPVVFYPFCVPVFTPIKDLSFHILTVFALSMWLLKIIFSDRLYFRTSRLDSPILLYLLVGCLSLFWSINRDQSILALPSFLAGPVLYFIVSRSLNKQKTINWLLLITVIVGTILGAYGIFQYLGIDFEFWRGNVARGQVFGLFGNVNYYAEYIIVPLALALGLFLFKERTWNRVFLLVAILMMGIALLLTFTRSSYLAIAIAIPVILFLGHHSSDSDAQKKYYKKLMLALLLIAVIASALVFVPHPFNKDDMPLGKLKNRISITALTSGPSVLRRVATWKFTWMMIEDRFLSGSGLGTYAYHSLKYQADFFSQGQNRDIYPHGYAMQAHNEYLQVWSELGIIGLLSFLWIIFVYFRTVLLALQKMKDENKGWTIGLAGGVTAVLIDAFFAFPLQLTASLSLFWIFIGLTGAQIHLIHENREEEEKRLKVQEKADVKNKVITEQAGGKVIRKAILSLLVIVMMIGAIFWVIKPFAARVYWYYGNQQIASQNQNQAIKMFERGLQWNPWQGELYYNIATILTDNGLNNKALEYFKKAEKYMDQHYLPQNIAIAYLKNGKMQEAIPYLEKAIHYQPKKKDMVPLYNSLGNTFITLKQYQRAEQSFLSAVEMDPSNATNYYGLAGAYLSQGKNELGVHALQKVIELDPESKVADYARMLLKRFEIEDEMQADPAGNQP